LASSGISSKSTNIPFYLKYKYNQKKNRKLKMSLRFLY
jgi:hypothetical protein